MTMDDRIGRIAVVGLGPRALGALEAFAGQSAGSGQRLAVDLFDSFPWPGAGPNFSPDQTPLCLLNIPLRGITMGAPRWTGAGTGTFGDWLGPAGADPERYPARAELGGYLAARFADLRNNPPAGLRLSRFDDVIRAVVRDEGGWWLTGSDGRHGPYAEILLTQGQPSTRPDDQLARWQTHARNCKADLVAAYPDHRLMRIAAGWTGRRVAVRGLGLSTLDVVRMLTCGAGGRFGDGRYHPSGREPAVILPFSLDGHAPVPKPATAALDARFDPTDPETDAFGAAVAAALGQGSDAALQTICAAMVAPARRILGQVSVPQAADDLEAWLEAERDRPGSQETRSPAEVLTAGIAEATGRAAPSAGYVVGQLMRKWQDRFRQAFNPSAETAPATAAAIVGFDDGLKRYSYGPPVSSSQELAILIEAGLVDLRAAEDPDILLTEDGWQLVDDDASARVTAMVDAVLPSPDLDALRDPLMTDLIGAGRAVAVDPGLGARTAPDGRLLDTDGRPQDGLCLLGRLALGSVVAVDSIHDCFGAAADRWAEGALSRLSRQAAEPVQ